MKQCQRGFTLIELVLAMGISGVVIGVIAMTTMTLLSNYQQPSSQQTLLQQVQNAGYQMPRDIQMSGNVTLGSPNGFPVNIEIPVDQNANNNYDVEYYFDSDILKRTQYDSLGSIASETIITRNVDTGNTTVVSPVAGLYRLVIKASMDEETVTASYETWRRLSID
ncbi:PilW family protein [Chloroflexota bacterium]